MPIAVRTYLSALMVAALVSLSAPALAQIGGVWLTEDGDAKIKIFACEDKFCGHIVWLEKPLDKNGKVKLDKNNPDESLRSRSIVGLPLLKNFTLNGDGVWEDGLIYSPRNGEFYKSRMRLEGLDTLKLRGYIGIPLFGQTETWTRVE